MKRVTLLVAALLVSSCSALAPKAPPNLTPQVTAKFYATYAMKDLDVVRDFANDASKTTPPLISKATLLLIVNWHETVVRTIHAAPAGWKAATLAALDELPRRLAPSDAATLRPYLEAAKTFAKEQK